MTFAILLSALVAVLCPQPHRSRGAVAQFRRMCTAPADASAATCRTSCAPASSGRKGTSTASAAGGGTASASRRGRQQAPRRSSRLVAGVELRDDSLDGAAAWTNDAFQPE
jgi:hypothetical protein